MNLFKILTFLFFLPALAMAQMSNPPVSCYLYDSSGNPLFSTGGALNVSGGGGGGGSNAAAGLTGAAVPTSAGYTGFNSGGNLIGVSSSDPFPVTASSWPLPTNACQESGGNLDSISTKLSTINTTLGSPFQTGGSIGNTSFIANAGTNLNTSALNLESTQSSFKSATHTDLLGINTTLGSPFQSGGSIGNSSFGISGTLPAFAATPTFNLGTLNGAATAAKQPALGTAGSASSDVITVQGISGMTALKTDGSGVTQPISGSVSVSNFPATQPVSGTVTANAGSGTFTVDASGHTVPISASSLPLPSGASTEASLVKIPLTQGSTTSGQSGALIQGAVTTSAPTYTTAQTNPLSLTTAGALRTDGSGTTQPVSGTVSVGNFPATQPVSGTVTANAGSGSFTVAQATASNLNANVSGTVTSNIGTTNGLALDATLTSGTQQTKITDGTNVATVKAASTAATGTDKAVVVAVSPNNSVAITAASLPLPAGAAQDASVTGLQVSQGSTTASQKGSLMQGAVTTSAPTYTTAQTSPLSLTPGGLLRVDGSGAAIPVTGTFFQATQPVSGTVTSNQGGAPWSVSQSGTWTTGRTWNLLNSTDSVNSVQSGNWSTRTQDGSGTSITSSTPNSKTGLDVNRAGDTVATAAISISLNGGTQELALTGQSTLAVELTSTGTGGTVQYELTIDGSTWHAITMWQQNRTSLFVTSSTGVGVLFGSVAGAQKARVRASALTSGTITGTMVASWSPSNLNINNGAYIAPSTTGLFGSEAYMAVGIDPLANTVLSVVSNAAGTQLAAVKAASTAAAAADPALVVAVSPNNTIPVNTTQFGGTNISTGTGSGGAGIPRVTISNDSSLAANQSVNVNQIAGSSISIAASGTQKVGISGATAVTLDAADNATAPTNGIMKEGFYSTTVPALSSGNAGLIRIDSTGSQYVNYEGRKQTYDVASIDQAIIASSTAPSFSITGSGTKTIRIQRIGFSATASTGGLATVILRRFSALSGGTSAAVANINKHDSGNATATAAPLSWSVAAGTATTAGVIRTAAFELPTPAVTVQPVQYEWDFGDKANQGLVLRGTSEFVGLCFSAIGTTPKAEIYVEWTEE